MVQGALWSVSSRLGWLLRGPVGLLLFLINRETAFLAFQWHFGAMAWCEKWQHGPTLVVPPYFWNRLELKRIEINGFSSKGGSTLKLAFINAPVWVILRPRRYKDLLQERFMRISRVQFIKFLDQRPWRNFELEMPQTPTAICLSSSLGARIGSVRSRSFARC